MSPEQGRPLRSRVGFAGRLLKVEVETVRMPNGIELELEMVRHPGAAAVVPLLSDPSAEDPQLLLLRQYRYAAGGTIWEIPAGVLEPGEEPVVCARRELKEETGAEAERMEHLTTVFTTPGFTDERIHIFLASGVRVGTAEPQSDEFLSAESVPVSRALQMIRDGEIVDSKSIVALLYLTGFRLGSDL